MPPGRKEAVRLTRNHATDRCPRWSPDGRRIAYLSTEAGLPKICITDYRGSRPTILKRRIRDARSRGHVRLVARRKEDRLSSAARDGRFASSMWATESPIPGRRGIGRWLRQASEFVLEEERPANPGKQPVSCVLRSPRDIPPRPENQANHSADQERRNGGLSGSASFVTRWEADCGGARSRGIPASREDLSGRFDDGTELGCLADADIDTKPQLALALRWSPDGKSLCYSTVRDKRHHIFLVDVSSKTTIQVTRGDCDDIEPDFTASK